jgi:hypothetical protein
MSVIKSRRMRLTGYVAGMGAKRNACRILVGKSDGKRAVRRPRRRWVDNVEMDFREIGWGDMDWIDLAEDRDQWSALVNMVMNLNNWRLLKRAQLHGVSLVSEPFLRSPWCMFQVVWFLCRRHLHLLVNSVYVTTYLVSHWDHHYAI